MMGRTKSRRWALRYAGYMTTTTVLFPMRENDGRTKTGILLWNGKMNSSLQL